jgi:branched-chain amino acid transport system ATP-binding protein
MPILEVKALSKRFGGVQALKNVSLTVNEAEIVALIGPNGAGKTSFFNCITGLLPVDSGEIFFCDGQARLDGLSSHRILEKGVARTFQNLRIFKNMTLWENVAVGFHARTRGGLWDALSRTRRFHVEEKKIFQKSFEWLEFVGLCALKNEIAGQLSYGSQKRLEIARALATDPKLLLLDEPVAGMNPTEKEELSKLIRRIRDRNIAVLLIEHDMKVVMPLSARVIVLDEGEKIAEGRPDEIKNNARVIKAYLGED